MKTTTNMFIKQHNNYCNKKTPKTNLHNQIESHFIIIFFTSFKNVNVFGCEILFGKFFNVCSWLRKMTFIYNVDEKKIQFISQVIFFMKFWLYSQKFQLQTGNENENLPLGSDALCYQPRLCSKHIVNLKGYK